MGAASSVPKGAEGENKSGAKNMFGSKLKRRLSAVNTNVPRVRRAGSDDKIKFMGVALDFSSDPTAARVPSGCQRCNCEGEVDLAAIEQSPDLHVSEFIEEEIKRVTTYQPNLLRTGVTARGAKYMGPWFHPESAAEAPKELRLIVPHFQDGQWVEPWHVTNWIKFDDPYTHVRSRFRTWRRVERTSLKPKPEPEDGQEAAVEEASSGSNDEPARSATIEPAAAPAIEPIAEEDERDEAHA